MGTDSDCFGNSLPEISKDESVLGLVLSLPTQFLKVPAWR